MPSGGITMYEHVTLVYRPRRRRKWAKVAILARYSAHAPGAVRCRNWCGIDGAEADHPSQPARCA
jgi:hypothetical protein